MADLESTVDRALARLDARPGWRLTCWQCGHSSEVPHDPERRSYRCDQCGAVSAFGVQQPPIAVVPAVDRRFVVSRIKQPRSAPDPGKVYDLTLERGYAAEYAMELLSVCDPELWRALCAIKDLQARAGGSNPKDASELIVGALDAVPPG